MDEGKIYQVARVEVSRPAIYFQDGDAATYCIPRQRIVSQTGGSFWVVEP